jgi:glycyl-tRNA synthetase beta chain
MKQTLLVELLTEELPPKVLSKLGDAFAAAMLQGLTQRSLADADASVIAYASPRRLAVSIAGVHAVAADKQIREKVLPLSVALDKEGQPTAPLTKKLAALALTAGREQITLSELERASDGKAESFYFS